MPKAQPGTVRARFGGPMASKQWRESSSSLTATPHPAAVTRHCSTTALRECSIGSGWAIVWDSGRQTALLGACEGAWPIATGAGAQQTPAVWAWICIQRGGVCPHCAEAATMCLTKTGGIPPKEDNQLSKVHQASQPLRCVHSSQCNDWQFPVESVPLLGLAGHGTSNV